MIQLTFNTTPQEIFEATLFFLFRKFTIKLSVYLIRIVSLLIILCFLMNQYIDPSAIAIKDVVFASCAAITLFFYKAILKKIISLKVKMTHVDAQQSYSIDQEKISFSAKQQKNSSISWKHLSTVYKNPNGFLIPISGLAYTGKFLWLPNRAFETKEALESFFKILTKQKVTLKEV